MPGWRLTILKPPLSSAVAVASVFVPLFLAVIVAPVTTSLFGFVTVPFIAPVVVDWAVALSAHIATRAREAIQNRTDLNIQENSLRKSNSLGPICARTIGRRIN